jgi:hypothetical protein
MVSCLCGNTRRSTSEKIDLEKQRHLFADIQFAKDLGARIIHLKTQNRIQAWLDFAEKGRNLTSYHWQRGRKLVEEKIWV